MDPAVAEIMGYTTADIRGFFGQILDEDLDLIDAQVRSSPPPAPSPPVENNRIRRELTFSSPGGRESDRVRSPAERIMGHRECSRSASRTAQSSSPGSFDGHYMFSDDIALMTSARKVCLLRCILDNRQGVSPVGVSVCRSRWQRRRMTWTYLI